MSIFIRLQNLPWSANSVDIRHFFSGLSIPVGGVHIVGGEMGDAFIAFSTDEDARLAMAKDGGKIKDMQIKLLLSSRTEMMRVIEQARQQNMVVAQPPIVTAQPAILTLQQPARIMTPTSESERRRAHSPSPPHNRSRERSPIRDRRRSPDDRRGSKRERSRSPSRSSRSFSRDMDRRSDRFKREDRRYDDSRYREDRRSSRDSPQESKKYLDADNVNRSQLRGTEGFRNVQNMYDQTQNVVMRSTYPFGNQSHSGMKHFPDTFTHGSTESPPKMTQTEQFMSQKSGAFPDLHQKQSTTYPQDQVSFRSSFEAAPSTKESSISQIDQQMHKPRRRTRFEPEFVSSPSDHHFAASNINTKGSIPENQEEGPSYTGRSTHENFSEVKNTWSHEMTNRSENTQWNEKRQTLLSSPLSKNGDYLQAVPMDLDPSPSDSNADKDIYQEPQSLGGHNAYGRNNASLRDEDSRREGQNRGPLGHKDQAIVEDEESGLRMESDIRGPVGMHGEARGPSGLNNENRGPTGMYNDGRAITGMHNDGRGPPGRHNENRGPPGRHNEGRGLGRSNEGRGPHIHNENRGPPMPGNIQGRVPPSLTVEVRGLAPDARIDDILNLFHGIPLPAANVRIEANDEGFEKAIIRFVSAADFEEALSRNRRFMHEGRCELVPCPAAAFDNDSRSLKYKPKPKPRESDLTIQLRGLPFSCKDDDVVRFFDGLGILDLYVDMAPDGRASGAGFVEFGTNEDFRSALAMNGKMIGHRYITVSVASKEMMAFARGEEYDPKGSLSGPYHGSGHLSQGRPPPSHGHIRPPLNQGRPPSNQGRVPPPSNQRRTPPPSNQGRAPLPGNQGRAPPPGNQGRAPPPDNQGRAPPPGNQGRAPPPSNQGRAPPPGNQGRAPPPGNQGRAPPPGNQGRAPPPGNQGRAPPPGNQGRAPPPPCISMKGLPEGVTNRDIANFLGEMGIMPRAVHIMLRPDKTPSGDAFAEFGGPADMETALQMNGKLMLDSRVMIQPISFYEMSEIVGRPTPIPPPPVPNALLRTPGDSDRPRRPLLSQGPIDGPFRERPRMEPPNRGNRPLLDHFKNHAEPRPFGPGRMRAPWPNRSFNGGNRPDGRFPPSERGIKDFGSPGCVVSINNLHFRAGLEELLDFFQDYNITKDNIIRKYNENGQTTGEARVAFQTPRDAQRVVRELNQKPIMGRPLTLSIL